MENKTGALLLMIFFFMMILVNVGFVSCKDESFNGNTTVSYDIVNNGFSEVDITGLKVKDNVVNLSYTFDNSGFIGESISIDVWVIDSNITEVKRMVDSFPINKEGTIKRNVLIELPEDVEGYYSIYLALSSDPEHFIRQRIEVGRTITTGNVVLGEGGKAKMAVYIVFIIIVIAGIFFIIKSAGKDSAGKVFHKDKHSWFVRSSSEDEKKK